jgi:alkylation response protein AidB-like acyl-CoA dehydrogenase
VAREVWNKAGENGFLCMTMPEQYGGCGADKLFSVIQIEEIGRGHLGIGFGLHSEIVAPYILHYGTEAQKAKYLPKLATGEMIGAIAMSEPAAGSDLAGCQNHRAPQPTAATCSMAARPLSPMAGMLTGDCGGQDQSPAGGKGTSLVLVERGMPGFSVGKRLKKVGMKAQDTSELFFDNVRLSADHLLGGAAYENKGFICLMESCPGSACKLPSARWQARRLPLTGRWTM